MTLIAGRPQPSGWTLRMNGAADHIPGYDDGEAQKEYRTSAGAPYKLSGNELETLEEIDRLTEINNN